MPILKTQDLIVGATIAGEVQNHSGRRLLPGGTVLTEKHILNLKAWGITEVDIQDEGVGSSPLKAEKVDPKKLGKAQKEIEALFCFSNQDHPAITELMRLASLNRLKKMPGMGHVDVK